MISFYECDMRNDDDKRNDIRWCDTMQRHTHLHIEHINGNRNLCQPPSAPAAVDSMAAEMETKIEIYSVKFSLKLNKWLYYYLSSAPNRQLYRMRRIHFIYFSIIIYDNFWDFVPAHSHIHSGICPVWFRATTTSGSQWHAACFNGVHSLALECIE